VAKNEARRGRGEGALYFDADKQRWVGRVTVDGRRRKVIGATKTETRKRLNEMRQAADRGMPITAGDLTVGELLGMWEAKALPNKHPSPSQTVSQRWAIRVLTAEIGSRRVRHLRPDDVEAALANRRVRQPTTKTRAEVGPTRPLSRSSMIKIRSTLNQAMTWAVRRELIGRNIAPLVELPRDAAPPRPGASLTVSEALRFLEAAKGTPLEAMWTVMLYLGLHPGEAAGLGWADVDVDSGIVHVWRGRKATERGEAVVGETKTPGSIRSLQAPPDVFDCVLRHRRIQAAQQLAAGPAWRNLDDLIFTSPTGRPTDPKAVRKEFDLVVTRAQLEGRWTPNLLRHSAASLMADAGMPIELVADQLGHRDLRMLQKHYRHRIRPSVAGGTVMGQVLQNPRR
jgi:integrase